MKQIPNIFTLLNLMFGCIAIVYTLQNGITIQYNAEGAQFVGFTEQIWLAPLFIGLAAVVDFFDGFVARLLNVPSEMGKQLDSLADVVSFGVAPSMIIYQFLRLSIAQQEDGLNVSMLWLAPAFFVAMAAAYRLARFNVSTDQVSSFRGVPAPANGLVVASFPLIYWNATNENVIALFHNKWMWYGIIAVLSYLMTSNLRMLAFKFKEKHKKAFLPIIVLGVIAIVSALLFQWAAVPLVFLAYIILSLVHNKKQS